MLMWWGIMLDVVDTPYRGGVLVFVKFAQNCLLSDEGSPNLMDI